MFDLIENICPRHPILPKHHIFHLFRKTSVCLKIFIPSLTSYLPKHLVLRHPQVSSYLFWNICPEHPIFFETSVLNILSFWKHLSETSYLFWNIFSKHPIFLETSVRNILSLLKHLFETSYLFGNIFPNILSPDKKLSQTSYLFRHISSYTENG